MIQINERPGPGLRAQLVGLGYYPSLATVSPIPPMLQKSIQEAVSGPSTAGGGAATGGSGVSAGGTTDTSLTPPPAPAPEGTNWLLWGGVGVGVLLLGLLIIRR